MGYSRRRYSEPKPAPKPLPYAMAEGPAPADVWKESTAIASGSPDRDGCAQVIVRAYTATGGLYMQVSTIIGWAFYPAVEV